MVVIAVNFKQKQNIEQPLENVNVQQTGSGNNGNIFYALGNVAGNVADSCQQLATDVAKIDLQNSFINRIKMMNTMMPMFGGFGMPVYTGNSIFPMYNQPAMQFPMFQPAMTQVPATSFVQQPFMFPNVCNHPVNAVFRLTSTAHLPQISSQTPVPLVPIYQDAPYNFSPYFGGNQQLNQVQQPTQNSIQNQTQQTPTITQTPTMTQSQDNQNNIDIDRILHSERYVQNQQSNNNVPKRTQVTATTAQLLGYEKRPTWYTDLLDIPQDKLTAGQKKLKEIFEKNMNEYSPYLLDANGNPVTDDAGMFKTNPDIHNKIRDLYDALIANDDDRVLKLINQYTADELSAIDYHWRTYCEHSQDNTERLTLRQMCQKACLPSIAPKNLKIKGGNYTKIFNALNEKTLKNNPSSMADAFWQGIHEESIADLYIDKDMIIKLLNMLKNDNEYAKAVAAEYQDRFGQSLSDDLRNGKLKTNPEAVKDLAFEVFN